MIPLSCSHGSPEQQTTFTGGTGHTGTSHASEDQDFIGRGKKAVGGLVEKGKKRIERIEGFINKGKN